MSAEDCVKYIVDKIKDTPCYAESDSEGNVRIVIEPSGGEKVEGLEGFVFGDSRRGKGLWPDGHVICLSDGWTWEDPWKTELEWTQCEYDWATGKADRNPVSTEQVDKAKRGIKMADIINKILEKVRYS